MKVDATYRPVKIDTVTITLDYFDAMNLLRQLKYREGNSSTVYALVQELERLGVEPTQ